MRTILKNNRWLMVLPVCLLLGGCPDIDDPARQMPVMNAEQTAAFNAKWPAAGIGAGAALDFENLIAAANADPINALITKLRGTANVADVELSIDGATVMVKLANGERVAIMTDQKSRAEWKSTTVGKSIVWEIEDDEEPDVQRVWNLGSRKGLELVENGATDNSIICNETTFPQSKKAILVMNFQTEFQQDVAKLREPLVRAGYEVAVVSIRTIEDLKKLNSLGDYGVIYMSSHGNVRRNIDDRYGNVLTTEIEINHTDQAAFAGSIVDMIELYGADFTRFVSMDAHKGKMYWSLTPQFFEQFTYRNTLVYADMCNSDKDVPGGTQLRDAFRNRGAGAFLGWKGPVSTRFSNPAAETIMEGLSPRVAGVANVTVATNPADPGAWQSYVPSARVTPALQGVELRLSVSGTDGYASSETKTTAADGSAVFTAIPGGAAGVIDTITVVGGGADNGATVVNTVNNNPDLQKIWNLPWTPQMGSKSTLSLSAEDKFNLICNNLTLTETKTVVKF